MSVLADVARAAIPGGAKRFLRERHRNLILARALGRVRRTPRDADIPAPVVRDLVYGWGNEGMSAGEGFIQALVRHAWDAPGPILECGAGLSTLLLGSVAERTGNRVCSLDHEPFWVDKVRATLAQHDIGSVSVYSAPLKSLGPHSWYAPRAAQLPADIGLVVCDGPPGDTPGGRYGLLPAVRSHLRPGCVILLDDAQRAGEQEALARWASELSVGFEILGGERAYGRIVVPA